MKAILEKRIVLLMALFIFIFACSQKRPVLYPNSYLKHVGKEVAEADIDDCIQLAKDYGVDSKSGDRIAKQTAKGAAIGGAGGAAVGAVTGNFKRGLGVGAAGGAAVAGTREALRSRDPDPVFKRFVEKCLRDKGYAPIGWK